MSLGARYLPHRQARCRGCGRPIIWCLTKKGRRVPIDAAPSPEGRFKIAYRDDEAYAVWVGERAPGDSHTAHFATCPKADDFRGKRGVTCQVPKCRRPAAARCVLCDELVCDRPECQAVHAPGHVRPLVEPDRRAPEAA